MQSLNVVCMYIHTLVYSNDATYTNALRFRSSPYSADDRSAVSVELEVKMKVTPCNSTDTEDTDPKLGDAQEFTRRSP